MLLTVLVELLTFTSTSWAYRVMSS